MSKGTYPGPLIPVGQHRLHMISQGEDGPTVVFEQPELVIQAMKTVASKLQQVVPAGAPL